MNLKERKLIGHFLEMLQGRMEYKMVNRISSVYLGYFDRKELIEIVLWANDAYDRNLLAEKTEEQLLELIGDEMYVLSYTIYKWKEGITAVPKLEQSEVHRFFDQIRIDPHYLRDKPVDQWDSYDTSNYYSILVKHGKIKRVFAIFTADVKSEDKYAVTTKPSYFFDTRKEAEKELENIIAEGQFTKKDLLIHSLWHLTQN